MNERSPAEVVFFAALEKASSAERTAYLDEACASDAKLRRRVEALLAAHAEVGQFLERPLAEVQIVVAPVEKEAVPELSFLSPSTEPGSLGRLDYYEVLEVVGRGGMGLVLRARDNKLLRIVAIKVLAAPLAASGTARQRFVREARAAAAIRDEHVIAIHAVCDDAPVPYLVMEFIRGCNLDSLIRRQGPLDIKEVLRIGHQIASGLAAAHEQGLIHRDVKPANILLENGVQRVKLTDFGLARAAHDASVTQSGLLIGTPLYMSPEQATGDPVDARADLFSLGSVLYEMCTGLPAFRASNTMAVLRRVCEASPRPIREVNPAVPDWLAALISKLHAKSPADRYSSAATVADLLGRHLARVQQLGIGAAQSHTELIERGPLPGAGSVPANRNRPLTRRLIAALVTGVALLVGTAAAYMIFGRPGTPPTPLAGGTSPMTQPGKAGVLPSPEQLAQRAAPADALRREDIPEALLQMAGNGDKNRALAELVAVFGENRHVGEDRRNHLNAVAISPDGQTLAFGGIDKIIRLVDLETKRERTLERRSGEGSISGLAFSPNRKVLASVQRDGTIVLWDVAAGTEMQSLAGEDTEAIQSAFSPDGKLLASAGHKNFTATVRLWDAESGKLLHTFEMPGIAKAWCVAFSPNGKTLAAGLEGGEVRLWDVGTRQEIATLATKGRAVRWVGFHPDGRSLAAAGYLPECIVDVWDLASRTPPRSLSGHRTGVLSGAWRADGQILITGGDTDGTVRFWDLSGPTPWSRALSVIPPALPWMHCLALSPEGRHLALCHPNGTVFVLRLARRGEVFGVPTLVEDR